MLRPDGRLSLDFNPIGHDPKDVYGAFGASAPSEDMVQPIYYGPLALRHHGQEFVGTVVSMEKRITALKGMGLVLQVFDEAILISLRGWPGIGHTHYSITGASMWYNVQSIFRVTHSGGLMLVHNGNLANIHEPESWLRELDLDQRVPKKKTMDSTNDTSLAIALMSFFGTGPIEQVAMKALPRPRGVFCLTLVNEITLFAARDPQGVYPLVLGRPATGWVITSETAALDTVGASFIREVEPGELIVTNEADPCSQCFTEARSKGCLFEYVYLVCPDTTIAGCSAHVTRAEIDRILTREHPVEVDLVIPTPDSGTSSAVGYAEASSIPFGPGLVKSACAGRTFIQSSQVTRQLGIRLKLSPLKEVITGKRLVVVDDSIVRGSARRILVRILCGVEASQVHMRISSPSMEWPCFYGTDFATRAELIMPGLGVNEARRSLGVDFLSYISLDALTEATHHPVTELYRACLDGRYPIAVPKGQAELLHLEEERAGPSTPPPESTPRSATASSNL